MYSNDVESRKEGARSSQGETSEGVSGGDGEMPRHGVIALAYSQASQCDGDDAIHLAPYLLYTHSYHSRALLDQYKIDRIARIITENPVINQARLEQLWTP